MKPALTLIIFLLIANWSNAQLRHSKTSAFKNYNGLVMAGYQGWFNAPGDSANRGWNHYVSHGAFAPGNCKIDLWPDVSEYEKNYPTAFTTADGKVASLFSSYDASTTNLHFKWMQQYGIDGVFMQRFVEDIRRPAGYHHNNTVLQHAFDAAEKYHRAIAVMYDLSGMHDSDYATVVNDWKMLVDSMHITNMGDTQTYLYHKGRPLVVIWGVGFNDGRKYTTQTVEKLLNFFKQDPVYGNCSVMLGVPTYWRDFGRDTEKDPYLHTVLKKADIIQPWFVGRFDSNTYKDFSPRIQADIDWCRANSVEYVPVIFPGFSWHNMNPQSPQNQIPREKGNFFWSQVTFSIQSGVTMLYIAMFDEIDEGTAIFKISKNPPAGLSHFVQFEKDVPPDHYLFLTGYAGKMLRNEIPLQINIPKHK